VSILCARVPSAPTNLADNTAATSDLQIGITWMPGFNGASLILDYRVSYDQASNNYVVIASGVTSTNFLVTSLNPGSTYKFKIEARNIVGYS
jgi:hypothetical protein